jgi:hypothetical protein
VLANKASTVLESLERVLQGARTDGNGSYHERAIGYSLGDIFVLFGCGKNTGRTHSRASILKCHVVGIDHAQPAESEIAHGPRCRPDVERIACVYQDDTEAVEFRKRSQAGFILTSETLSKNYAMESFDTGVKLSIICQSFVVARKSWENIVSFP